MSDEAKTAPVPVAEAAPTPAPTPEPAKIQVDPAEYANLWKQSREFADFKAQADAEKKSAVERAQQEHLARLAEEKGAKAALEEQRAKLLADFEAEKKSRVEVESAWLNEKKENVLASAMAGVEFASKAAHEQARAILASRFEVSREDGKVVVRDRSSGRYAGEQIPSLLASDEFAHFLAPRSRGGTGSGGGDKPAAAATTDPADAQGASLKAFLERQKKSTIGL